MPEATLLSNREERASAMSNQTSPKRQPAHQGRRTIIPAASVAATLGGWAVFANQPLPATGAAPAATVAGQAPSTTPANPNGGLLPAQPAPAQPSLGQSGNGSSQTPFGGRRRRFTPSTGSDQPSTGSSVPSFGGSGQAP